METFILISDLEIFLQVIMRNMIKRKWNPIFDDKKGRNNIQVK